MSEPGSSRLSPACTWPGCGNDVTPGDPFCREHWYRLPYGHRVAVYAALVWVREQASGQRAA